MFNPEGVKGKTAQPPHKIFNFMDTQSQAFLATFSIKDAATQIEIFDFNTIVWNRSEYRAKLDAQHRAEAYTHGLSRESIAKRYGLTALQLRAMRADGVLADVNFYEVELKTFQVEPNPPKRVGQRKYWVTGQRH